MNHDLTVTGSINVKATQERVWDVMTKPELIKIYLYGTNTESTWEPGTPVVFSGEWEGNTYRDLGVVKENIPNKLLSYSYWSGFSGTEDKPENYSLVTYEIEPLDAETTNLKWIQKGYASDDSYEHSKGGIEEFMDAIKQVIEG